MPQAPTAHGTRSDESKLLRTIGFWSLAASVVNLSIGGSIFVLPAVLASTLGSLAPWPFILGALVFVPITACFSVAGSRVSSTGGPYSYVRVAFGPFPGFLVGTIFWISNAAGAASMAAALIDQGSLLVPQLSQPALRISAVILTYALLCAVNALGIRAGARSILVLAIVKLAPLALVTIIGAFFIHPMNLAPPATIEWTGIGNAMVIVIFAYSGVEIALSPSGEVANPSRVVPRAALAGVTLIVLLYVGLQIVALGILGTTLGGRAAPLADVAARLVPGGYQIVVATASIAMFGVLQGDLLGSSRLIFALARDGFLPSPLAHVSNDTRVPVLALLGHAGVVCLLTAVGNFKSLALMSGGAYCLLYLASCAAAWQLQRKDIREHGTPFSLPGGPLIPLIACIALIVILTTLQASEWHAITYCLCGVLTLYTAVRGKIWLRRTPA